MNSNVVAHSRCSLPPDSKPAGRLSESLASDRLNPVLDAPTAVSVDDLSSGLPASGMSAFVEESLHLLIVFGMDLHHLLRTLRGTDGGDVVPTLGAEYLRHVTNHIRHLTPNGGVLA